MVKIEDLDAKPVRRAPDDLPSSLRNYIDYRKSGLSLNHIVGCPLDCGYCVRHLFNNFAMKRPHLIVDDEIAVEELVRHWAFRADTTPIQIFNRATDPFLPGVKTHLFRTLEALDILVDAGLCLHGPLAEMQSRRADIAADPHARQTHFPRYTACQDRIEEFAGLGVGLATFVVLPFKPGSVIISTTIGNTECSGSILVQIAHDVADQLFELGDIFARCWTRAPVLALSKSLFSVSLTPRAPRIPDLTMVR